MKDQYAFTAFWPGKLLMAVLVTLVVTVAVLFGQSGQAWAYPAVTVLVNGSKVAMDVLPIIEDGRTLVPVRAVGEALGASVEWNQKTRKVTVKNSQDTIVLTIDSNAATVSGLPKPLDVPARIVAGRTVIPLRFVSENFGARVTWDQASYTVTIDTANQTAPPEEAVVKLESELLTLLNQQRAKLNYKPMILLAPLTEMARGQAADMAKSGNFSHNSATYGDIHQRSQEYGLPPCCEFLAYGYPFADKILGSWLEGDNGAVLLAEQTHFIGLGFYRGGAHTISDIYGVCEVFGGPGMIKGERERSVTDENIDLCGWLAENSAALTIYKLAAATGQYESRQSYYLSANQAGGTFTFSFQLWGAGTYRVCLGEDSILIHCNSVK